MRSPGRPRLSRLTKIASRRASTTARDSVARNRRPETGRKAWRRARYRAIARCRRQLPAGCAGHRPRRRDRPRWRSYGRSQSIQEPQAGHASGSTRRQLRRVRCAAAPRQRSTPGLIRGKRLRPQSRALIFHVDIGRVVDPHDVPIAQKIAQRRTARIEQRPQVPMRPSYRLPAPCPPARADRLAPGASRPSRSGRRALPGQHQVGAFGCRSFGEQPVTRLARCRRKSGRRLCPRPAQCPMGDAMRAAKCCDGLSFHADSTRSPWSIVTATSRVSGRGTVEEIPRRNSSASESLPPERQPLRLVLRQDRTV